MKSDSALWDYLWVWGNNTIWPVIKKSCHSLSRALQSTGQLVPILATLSWAAVTPPCHQQPCNGTVSYLARPKGWCRVLTLLILWWRSSLAVFSCCWPFWKVFDPPKTVTSTNWSTGPGTRVARGCLFYSRKLILLIKILPRLDARPVTPLNFESIVVHYNALPPP
jgi:hypothetical protein